MPFEVGDIVKLKKEFVEQASDEQSYRVVEKLSSGWYDAVSAADATSSRALWDGWLDLVGKVASSSSTDCNCGIVSLLAQGCPKLKGGSCV